MIFEFVNKPSHRYALYFLCMPWVFISCGKRRKKSVSTLGESKRIFLFSSSWIQHLLTLKDLAVRYKLNIYWGCSRLQRLCTHGMFVCTQNLNYNSDVPGRPKTLFACRIYPQICSWKKQRAECNLRRFLCVPYAQPQSHPNTYMWSIGLLFGMAQGWKKGLDVYSKLQ